MSGVIEAGDSAIVLMSGGIDSAVALWWALDRGLEAVPISFDYYRRPPGEIDAVDRLTRVSGTRPAIRVPLPFLREMDDLRGPGLGNPSLVNAPDAYLPARNLVFYSLAAHYAETLGARWLVGGHNGADGDTFPDATHSFFEALDDALRLGLISHENAPLEVALPLLGRTKAQVVRLGVELGVPLELTWSCWWDREEPCGACESCIEREAAFAEGGVTGD